MAQIPSMEIEDLGSTHLTPWTVSSRSSFNSFTMPSSTFFLPDGSSIALPSYSTVFPCRVIKRRYSYSDRFGKGFRRHNAILRMPGSRRPSIDSVPLKQRNFVPQRDTFQQACIRVIEEREKRAKNSNNISPEFVQKRAIVRMTDTLSMTEQWLTSLGFVYK